MKEVEVSAEWGHCCVEACKKNGEEEVVLLTSYV